MANHAIISIGWLSYGMTYNLFLVIGMEVLQGFLHGRGKSREEQDDERANQV